MKNRILNIAAVLTAVIMFTSFNTAPATSADGFAKQNTGLSSDLINVNKTINSEIDINQVYAARFLNMLNHNYVYGDSFKSLENMVNDSMPALLNLSDEENDSFIAEQYVSDYIFNMYGIEINDFSGINSDFEHLEGYVYILPRGYSIYKHQISSISQNEDGSFTVITNVEILSHDGEPYKDVCETLFVRNERSAFGFSIIHSNIGQKASAV